MRLNRTSSIYEVPVWAKIVINLLPPKRGRQDQLSASTQEVGKIGLAVLKLGIPKHAIIGGRSSLTTKKKENSSSGSDPFAVVSCEKRARRSFFF
jgi:hypothetical protein